MDLDAPSGYSAVDPADALGDVEATADQWRSAVVAAPDPIDLAAYDNVVIAGMGGSGIAGDVLWALSLGGYPRPVIVHKGYGVPAFVRERTLVVTFSHSGSTEEALSAFDAAGEAGAARLVVTSGGQLAERAQAEDVDVALMPRDSRPPRHSLGSLLVPALVALGLDDGLPEAIDTIDALAKEFGRRVPAAVNPLKRLGNNIATGVVPLAWGGHGIGSVAAYRLKCQLNENAKSPAIHGELPEADHNDVVGWEAPSPLRGSSALIALRDPAGEHSRISHRFEITAEMLSDRLAWHAELYARGESALARVASLLIQADLVSIYAALAADRDPTPIRSIDRLKSELSDAGSRR